MNQNIIINELKKHAGENVTLHRTSRIDYGILAELDNGLFSVGNESPHVFLAQNISNMIILGKELNIVVTY